MKNICSAHRRSNNLSEPARYTQPCNMISIRKEEMTDESVHRKHVREAEEAYGINFVDWQRKLDEIDRENRIIKSNIHKAEVKKDTEEKRQLKAQEKERTAKELEFRKEQVIAYITHD